MDLRVSGELVVGQVFLFELELEVLVNGHGIVSTLDIRLALVGVQVLRPSIKLSPLAILSLDHVQVPQTEVVRVSAACIQKPLLLASLVPWQAQASSLHAPFSNHILSVG